MFECKVIKNCKCTLNMDIDKKKHYHAFVILSSCTCMNTFISVYILNFDVIEYLYAGK